MTHRQRHARGFSFPIVILLVSVLSAAAATSVVVMASAARTTGGAIDRRRTFYACDGVARAAAVAARPYLASAAIPDTSGLRTAVCGSALLPCAGRAAFADEGYTIDNLVLDVLPGGGAPVAVPNGPFRGMTATQNRVQILVEVTNATTASRCRVRQTMTLAEIGLFQFLVFADGYTDAFPTTNLDLMGRVHANGDFCAHSASALVISQLTSAGRILATCPRHDAGAGTAFFLHDNTSTPLELNAGCHNSCVTCGAAPNCGPDAGDWRAYALSRWDGRVLDTAHNVPQLRLPIAGAAVQDGRDASGAPLDNSASLRVVVDPPRLGEDAQVRQARYAMKADLRILDGVWFKNDGTWPGVPIWSDHPGSYRPPAGSPEETVVVAGGAAAAQTGQKELFCDPGTAVPRGYSYYAHDCGAPGAMHAPRDGTGAPTTRSVVSYGSLFRGAGPVWFPGVDGVRADGVTTEHLRATRAGFQDLRVRDGVSGGDAEKYRVLPLNFDVAAFAAALQDNTGAELGSHFTPGTFNGIVYIANTWTGVFDNMSALATAQAAPPLWPDVDDTAGADPGLPNPASFAIENDRLPRALCADASTARAWSGGWSVPVCTGPTTAINAVRVINAATLDPAAFPLGLSIVTNGPAYVLGDANTGSVMPSGLPAPAPPLAPSLNWRPFMVGADAITFLSSGWDDRNADWGDPHSAGALATRVPVATTWVLAALHGNVETSAAAPGGGIEGSARFLEQWGGGPARLYGSMVVGFRSVQQRQPFVLGSVQSMPQLALIPDARFASGTGRPPGAPSFFVQATEAWSKQ